MLEISYLDNKRQRSGKRGTFADANEDVDQSYALIYALNQGL